VHIVQILSALLALAMLIGSAGLPPSFRTQTLPEGDVVTLRVAPSFSDGTDTPSESHLFVSGALDAATLDAFIASIVSHVPKEQNVLYLDTGVQDGDLVTMFVMKNGETFEIIGVNADTEGPLWFVELCETYYDLRVWMNE